MEFVIDLGDLQQAAGNPFTLMWVVFRDGGWIVASFALGVGVIVSFFQSWVANKQRAYMRKTRYVMLALDIPKGNEQTPKAVEAIFAHLHGVQKKGNLKERYLRGYVQPQFSFEIIGIEGQTQFLIRTPEDSRDVVEAAVYAQYPDAEITEVVDYTDFIPDDFAAAGYDFWGTELILSKSEVYPIKTYPFFEHTLSQQFLDPLASLLELMSRMGPTEQVWLQLVMTPADSTHWREKAEQEVKKKLGVKTEAARSFLATLPGQVAGELYGTVTATLLPPGEKKKEEKKQEKPNFAALTSGEKAIVEGIQIKGSKLGWQTKFRFLYLAKKEFLRQGKGVNGIMGAIKQYNTQDLNGFTLDKKTRTKIDYFFTAQRVRQRKERLLYNYKHRVLLKKFQKKNFLREAKRPFILNTEELASLFHFPVITVKAPMMQRTEAKRGEPPMTLPVQPLEAPQEVVPVVPGGPPTAPGFKGEPPMNLPT